MCSNAILPIGLVNGEADGDGDGVAACVDCDDAVATINSLAVEVCDTVDNNCDGVEDEGLFGLSAACAASSCLEIYEADNSATDGNYYINPSGTSTIQVACNMTNGGETLCASLTKGYVPAHMLYDQAAYAFQARLNSAEDYVYETDEPSV